MSNGCDMEWIRRAVGQVFAFGFRGSEMDAHIQAMIAQRHLGNVILFAENIVTKEQTRALTESLQRLAKDSGQALPLTIGADQENGIVRRLREGFTLFPGSMTLGAADNEKLTEAVARATGEELRAVGVNMNYAPVLDVNNNPANPVIGVRSFGADAERVACHGVASLRGYAEAGVIACGKHFPGHGDTDVDSHLALPRVPHGRIRLDEVELKPFRAAFAFGMDAVMTAHVAFPALEARGVPATISRAVVTDLLRRDLGFEGVIATDSLGMKAISATVGVARGALEAFAAGCDLLMIADGCEEQIAAYDMLVDAVAQGVISCDRLQASLERIETLKRRRLAESGDSPMAVIRSQPHLYLARRVAEAGVTVLRGADRLPLRLAPEDVLLCVPSEGRVLHEAQATLQQGTVVAAVRQRWPRAVVKSPQEAAADHGQDENVAGSRALIVELAGRPDESLSRLLDAWAEAGKAVIGIATQSPYDVRFYPQVEIVVATYDRTPVSVAAAIGIAFGDLAASGAFPGRL